MDPEVRRRRLTAGKTRDDQQAWLAPTVSLGETHDEVRDDLGAMVVAMANRAMRGDLAERGVPAELHADVEEMWRSYDYGFHADNSRPRNTGVVSDALASHLIDSLCLWGDEERWRTRLDELEDEGWTGVMLILGQATQLEVLERIGQRLQALGQLDWPRPRSARRPAACRSSRPRRRRGRCCAGGRPWRPRAGARRLRRAAARSVRCTGRGRWRRAGGPWRSGRRRG